MIESLLVSSVGSSSTGESSCIEIDSFGWVIFSDVGIDARLWEVVAVDLLRRFVDVAIGDGADFTCTFTGFGESSNSSEEIEMCNGQELRKIEREIKKLQVKS